MKMPKLTRTASLILDKSHPLSDLYYKKARYKVYWGGRGSAKSWGFAEALVRLAAALPLRILCCREYQNSIKDSSHKILKDTIERLGLQSWFTITKDSITSRTGAEFMFKGLFNNENGIRSTEGIDICWVEEAHSVSSNSWRVLLPTIRKTGSEIWISFNMMEETDATYQMFVEQRRRGGHIVHKVNYDSNPFFPDELREEMETDKANDYHLYEHIWLGMPHRVGNHIIFAGKYAVREFDRDDVIARSDRPFFGIDFGFSQDPMAVMRSHIVERDHDLKRRLYVTHGAYASKVEINEMPEFLDSVPGIREWNIKADAARPEIISHLRGAGFAVSAAEKWDGSVKDGIAHLRGFDEIVIYPTVPGLPDEARRYQYKVDPKQLDERGQPVVLPIVIDKHNHAWDSIRYSLDGYIMRSGDLGLWARLGRG